jgi:spermidine synthase
MARSRVSTTVDEDLLSAARALRAGLADAALLDEALAALIARNRAAEIDAAYSAYDKHPLDEPDEWGDLASFGRAAASS